MSDKEPHSTHDARQRHYARMKIPVPDKDITPKKGVPKALADKTQNIPPDFLRVQPAPIPNRYEGLFHLRKPSKPPSFRT